MERNNIRPVTTSAIIENLYDIWSVERGLIAADNIRRIVVHDAIVDMQTTMISMPLRLINQLGLTETSHGVFEVARLTIQDRFCTVDVREAPDDSPVLIGRLPLLQLDFVIDTQNQSLIGNPAHGGEHVIEMY